MATRIKFDAEKFKKNITKNVVEEQTRRLVEYAREELYEMILTKTFHSRTFNLVDSYVWAVFYNRIDKGHGFVGGKMATEKSLLHEWGRSPIPVDGRKEANDFLSHFKGSGAIDNGWTIVWAACAPYARYLDTATGSSKTNRFLVISQRYDHITNTLEPKCKVELRIG